MKATLKAEWEEQRGFVLALPPRISDWGRHALKVRRQLLRLAREIAPFIPVYLLNGRGVGGINSPLHSVDMTTNDTWARDYMPLSLKAGDKTLLKKFIFDGWGGKFNGKLDNEAGNKINEILSLEVINENFILEGGNIECNGCELLTNLSCLLKRNNHKDTDEIKEYLREVFGIKEVLFIKSGFLEGDDTDAHIDNLARFINKDSICYLSPPIFKGRRRRKKEARDPHFKSLTTMKEELRTLKNTDGKPFKLIPLPFPNSMKYKRKRLPLSYVNFIFINDGNKTQIIVPSYRKNNRNNKNTLRILRKSSGFIVKEFPSNLFVLQGGSLHCTSASILK